MGVNNKEDPQERPDRKNRDWAAWPHKTDQVFLPSYGDLRETANVETTWSKTKSILSVRVGKCSQKASKRAQQGTLERNSEKVFGGG